MISSQFAKAPVSKVQVSQDVLSRVAPTAFADPGIIVPGSKTLLANHPDYLVR
jgi:hypothetical protein